MELIVSGNPNISTITNVVYFANKHYEYKISQISFLDNLETLTSSGCSIESSRNTAIRKYIPEVSITSHVIEKSSIHSRIPQIISDRLRFHHLPDQLIIDLTNGNKHISSILYASASLSKISNLFFLLVNRDRQNQPPELLESTDYAIDIVQGLENIQNIGKHSYFEIVYYQDKSDELSKEFDAYKYKKDEVIQFHTILQSAIRSYFQQDYRNVINNIGTVAEFISDELCHRLKNKAKGVITEKIGSDLFSKIQWLFTHFCEPLRSSKQELNGEFFVTYKVLKNIDKLLDLIRVHRNLTSHPYTTLQGHNEARLMISTIFYLLNLLVESRVFE